LKVIHSKVKTDIEKQQRDYFLHQQMKTKVSNSVNISCINK